MNGFTGRVVLVQRVVPNYRAPFFNALGRACAKGLNVFAGKPRPREMINPVDHLEIAHLTQGKNLHLFGHSLYLCIQLGLLDWLEGWNPDALILEANPRYLRTPAVIRWMHQRKRPVIGWGLGAPPLHGPIAPFRQLWRLRFIQQFDALITYSQTGAEEYAALGYPQSQIFIAINAVSPPPTHPLPARRGLTANEKAQVLFVGRLQARKKIDNLLKACAGLPKPMQPKLVIVGDGPARESLEALALKIYPTACFTGAKYGNELEQQFRSADLFVLPGTGGLAIQQAMSFGLPVIAAEADGTQADLVRNENGWQIPPDDISALGSILQEALSNVPRLREMGAESYRIVADEINLDKMVSAFVEALNRTIL